MRMRSRGVVALSCTTRRLGTCLLRVKLRKAQAEHFRSALGPIATVPGARCAGPGWADFVAKVIESPGEG